MTEKSVALVHEDALVELRGKASTLGLRVDIGTPPKGVRTPYRFQITLTGPYQDGQPVYWRVMRSPSELPEAIVEATVACDRWMEQEKRRS